MISFNGNHTFVAKNYNNENKDLNHFLISDLLFLCFGNQRKPERQMDRFTKNRPGR